MKTIKMILCDVDGTLLNKAGDVSPSTIEAIKKIKSKGLLFGLATGRDIDITEPLYEEWGILGLVDAFVGLNGAHIKDYRLGIESHSHYMAPELLKQIIAHFEDLPVNFAISENGTFYMPYDNEVGRLFANQDRIPLEIIDYDLYLVSPKPKLHILCHEEDMPQVIERSRSFSHPDAFGVKTDSILFEYIDPRVSKAKGAFKIAQFNHLAMEEIMAFGDADNDIAMLKEVGIGVAMGNASPGAKAAAKHETLDNDHDGIANFINQYFA